MAVIKIPSKNIYEKDNQKVIDNIIDKIEVQAKQPSIVTEEEAVFSDALLPISEFSDTSVKGFAGNGWDTEEVSLPNRKLDDFVAGYAAIIPLYNKYEIKIPVQTKDDNGYIRELSFTNDGGLDANYSMTGYKETMPVEGYMTITDMMNTAPNSRIFYIKQIDNATITQSGSIEKEKNIPITFDDTIKSIHISLRSSSNYTYDNVDVALENDLTNVQTPSLVKMNNEYWIMSFQILVGLDKIQTTSTVSSVIYNYDNPLQIPLVGTEERYRAEQVSLTVNGVVVKLNLTDKTLTIGNGKNIMSFSGNELVQTTNSPSIETQYQAVINEWQNGKETATLTCDIADYYDTDGNLAISANNNDTLPMTFHIGDIVVPYVYGANGADKPMSTYADGTPKVFTVIGKHPSKTGAVWQEITLQEKTN